MNWKHILVATVTGILYVVGSVAIGFGVLLNQAVAIIAGFAAGLPIALGGPRWFVDVLEHKFNVEPTDFQVLLASTLQAALGLVLVGLLGVVVVTVSSTTDAYTVPGAMLAAAALILVVTHPAVRARTLSPVAARLSS